MKGSNYILNLKWILIIISGVLIGGCEPDIKPIEKIYKANSPKGVTKNKLINIYKKVPKSPKDSINKQELIIPPDSNSNTTKDTTETLHQIEKKTETKPYKRLYLYNIHKRAPVS